MNSTKAQASAQLDIAYDGDRHELGLLLNAVCTE